MALKIVSLSNYSYFSELQHLKDLSSRGLCSTFLSLVCDKLEIKGGGSATNLVRSPLIKERKVEAFSV